MRAWAIQKTGIVGEDTLRFMEFKEPDVSSGEILLKVKACGVCHTELDEIEGRLKPSFLPIIPGHQIVGKVVEVGPEVSKFKVGDLAGVGWIFWACGNCEFCSSGFENLCINFKGTGLDAHGGYAEYFKIGEDFAFRLPHSITPEEIAPLFCAGSIGYRALRLASIRNGHILGLVGFGASNHLVLKMAKRLYPLSPIFVFTRNPKERELALSLGADYAGDLHTPPPDLPHAIIDTTPVWKPAFYFLRFLRPGGRLVINAIRKEEIDKDFLLEISYERDLWLEREVKTVANITRRDIQEFLDFAINTSLKPEIELYSFEEARIALIDMKNRKIRGAKVLKME